jgi:hypothetical protein
VDNTSEKTKIVGLSEVLSTVRMTEDNQRLIGEKVLYMLE